MSSVLAGLGQLPASKISVASIEIVEAARLVSWRNCRPLSETFKFRSLWQVIKPVRSEFDQLQYCPELAWLFLFHGNGHVREAALKAINTAPASAFFLSALLLRLNDWVQPVRTAAVQSTNRVFPNMKADIAADVAVIFLARYMTWGRWLDAERIPLDGLFGRTDVIAAFVERLCKDRVGALATCLRHALRYPALDVHLLTLARDAVQPAVRATAFECLAQRSASWPIGYGWEWEDKVFNLKKKVPLVERREIQAPPLNTLIREGLMDRSVFVRRAAADALIANRRTLSNSEELAQLLGSDANPSIQERADYLRRHKDSN